MTTFHIPDMNCGHCRATIEKTIHAFDPAAQIKFDMTARQITIESSTDAARVAGALAGAGYPASPV